VGNNVEVVVDGKNRTAQAFGDAAKGAKTVGDAADIAAKQLRDMDAKLEAADTKARKLAQAEEQAAEKARRMAQDLGLLKRELAESGDESGKLSRKIDRLTTDHRVAAQATEEYRRAANRAAEHAREQARAYDRVAANAREAARAVVLLGAASALGGNGKGKGGSLFGVGSDVSAGFFKGGLGGATSALEGSLGTPVLGPALIAAIAAAAIPAASFVGGAAGGAVTGGIGAAGAGAGLAGAWAGDPERFNAQWNKSIDNVAKRWKDSSRAFGSELASDLSEVDRVMRDLPIERILALSQGLSTPLVQGAGGGATNVANGLADALEKAEPIIENVGPKLANLGQSIGDAFRMISEGSEGGSHALGDLIDAMGYAVRVAGIMILGFENAYEGIRDFTQGLWEGTKAVPLYGDVLQSVASGLFDIHSSTIVAGRSLKDTTEMSGGMIESWAEMAAAAAAAAVETFNLNDALAKHRDLMLQLADANLAVAQGWLDLNEELKDGAKTLDMTKQAGLDNEKAILSQVEALERQRQQAIETGGGTVEATNAANAAYDASIQKLRQAAIAAGFNAQQVDRLLASLGALPSNTTTTVSVPGLSSALSQGISLGNALNRIDGQKYEANVYVNYHQQGQALNAPLRTGGIGHAAAGGAQDGMTLVGEEGPEYVRLPRGSMVYPNANTNQMLAGRGGGGQTVAVQLEVVGQGELYELLMAAQREGKFQVLSSAIV
jgi:hypothetical protein